MSIPGNIGMKVKQLRVKAGMNQAQIAAFLGVERGIVSKCEKGKQPFSVDQLEKIGNLFDVNVADLMSGDDPLETPGKALRMGQMGMADLVAIAEINRIALNLSQMRQLSKK